MQVFEGKTAIIGYYDSKIALLKCSIQIMHHVSFGGCCGSDISFSDTVGDVLKCR